MRQQTPDDEKVFHTFSLCTGHLWGKPNWQALLYQLEWGNIWNPCPRLSTALAYLVSIGAIEKMQDAQYRRTQKGFDMYGQAKYKGEEGPLSGITYEPRRATS